MQLRQIPNTELHVSPICMGTMTFGTPVAEPEAIQITQWAIDHGVNFIDTANMYEGYARHVGSAGGVAEEILGKALKGRRDRAVLATKVGMKVGEGPEDEGTSPAAIRTQLDRSLRRLATDYVDIYYLHKPDPDVPLADILGGLNEVISQGKVRYCGVSNYSAQQLAELLEVAASNGLPRPVVLQPPYSLLARDMNMATNDQMARDTERDLLPLCAREQIGVVPYRVLQSGLLTGKYRRGGGSPPGSRQAEKPGWVPELTDEMFDHLERIEQQAQEAELSMTAFSIRWMLEQPAMVSAIIGVKRTQQLEEAMAAAS